MKTDHPCQSICSKGDLFYGSIYVFFSQLEIEACAVLQSTHRMLYRSTLYFLSKED